MYFTFAFNDQADSNRLNTSGRKCRFHFSPKHGREFETYDTIQNPSCLLCIYEVEVNVAWLLNRF